MKSRLIVLVAALTVILTSLFAMSNRPSQLYQITDHSGTYVVRCPVFRTSGLEAESLDGRLVSFSGDVFVHIIKRDGRRH